MMGAVAAGHPLTAEVGAGVLRAGGNAVDACVAAAAASWVVESTLTGPGAGGSMLVHRARDRRDILLDFSVAIPGLGLAEGEGGAMEVVHVAFGSGGATQEFHVGGASCAVPGTVAGIAEGHRLFGRMPWPELLAPAIRLAKGGFALSETQAWVHELLEAVLHRDESGQRIYGPPDRLRAGERIVLAELGHMLEQLATEGAAAFYTGDIGRALSATVTAQGGRVTEADLASYRPIRRRPVRASYRGFRLVSNPPPSSGGVLIAYALRLLDRLGAGGHAGSAEAIAMLAEVARETARARTPGFAAALHRGGLAASLLSDERVALAAHEIEGRLDRSPAVELAGLPSTTHISVLDSEGNAASLSASLGCGSGVFVPGTGVHLNNMLGEIDLNPHGHGGGPVGRRLTSMMAPSMLLGKGVRDSCSAAPAPNGCAERSSRRSSTSSTTGFRSGTRSIVRERTSRAPTCTSRQARTSGSWRGSRRWATRSRAGRALPAISTSVASPLSGRRRRGRSKPRATSGVAAMGWSSPETAPRRERLAR